MCAPGARSITMKHMLMLAALWTAALGFVGCNDSGGGGGDPADTNTTDTASASTNNSSTSDSTGSNNNSDNSSSSDTSASQAIDLTGRWVLSGKTGIYRLKQSGASLQGMYYDAVDHDVGGDIAGSVKGRRVEMDVLVQYASHPADNFTAHKSGTIINNDHMVLTVTAGPMYVGNVQNWYRH